jgi:hypothetical protein
MMALLVVTLEGLADLPLLLCRFGNQTLLSIAAPNGMSATVIAGVVGWVYENQFPTNCGRKRIARSTGLDESDDLET